MTAISSLLSKYKYRKRCCPSLFYIESILTLRQKIRFFVSLYIFLKMHTKNRGNRYSTDNYSSILYRFPLFYFFRLVLWTLLIIITKERIHITLQYIIPFSISPVFTAVFLPDKSFFLADEILLSDSV